ncbi:LamG domain-containing protein, partial [bacterium]|nr:LamG domain-containing protein [bacterium]
MIYRTLLLLFLIWPFSSAFGEKPAAKGNPELVSKIKSTSGLVALWDFKEEAGKVRKAFGKGKYPLKEQKGLVPRLDEGPLSGYSALFRDSAFLRLPNSKTGKLNIYGKNQGLTVMAWVKWEGKTGFVGGMW